MAYSLWPTLSRALLARAYVVRLSLPKKVSTTFALKLGESRLPLLAAVVHEVDQVFRTCHTKQPKRD